MNKERAVKWSECYYMMKDFDVNIAFLLMFLDIFLSNQLLLFSAFGFRKLISCSAKHQAVCVGVCVVMGVCVCVYVCLCVCAEFDRSPSPFKVQIFLHV